METPSEAPGSGLPSPSRENASENANASAKAKEAKETASCIKKSYRHILILRLTFMLMLVILLGGSTAAAYFLSRVTWEKSLTQLVHSYQDDLTQRSSDDIVHLFNSGSLCGRVLEGMVQRIYVAPLNDSSTTNRDNLITRAIFDTFTDCAQTSSLALIKEDGTYTVISSSDNVTLGNNASVRVLMSFNNQSTPAGEMPPRYTTYLSEVTGDPVTSPQRATPIDPRLRDYYVQAKTSTDGVAAQLLVGASGRPQFVLACRVVLPKSGQFLGVVTISFYLTTISRFMSEFDLKGGLMYVTNGTMLVADTVNDYPVVANNQTNPVIVPVTESSNPVVRESFAYLRQLPGTDNRSISREVHLGGSPYFLHYKDLLFRNITLRQVLVLPRGSVMGSIDRDARVTTAIVSGVAAAICALGFVMIVVFTDPVSKEMRLKAQVIENLEAKRQAEAREEFKTNFFSRTSHDLRTPSAAMLGLLDVIIEAEHDPEQTERVQQVKDCALNQLHLLNDILDFSKMEAGKMKLESELFDIGGMLESLTDFLSVQCAAKDVEIGLDMSEAVPRIVKGDETRCRQIFANLISNSIKFTQEGYVLIRCTAGPPETPPHPTESLPTTPRVSDDSSPQPSSNFLRLNFEVEDTGCGIPPEKRALVFQDYCQADGASTTRNHGGTGLGLGIVKTLVELMNGQIQIVNKDGPGTVFKFYLQFERDVIPSGSRLLDKCPSFVMRHVPPPLSSFDAGFHVVLGIRRPLARTLAGIALRRQGVAVVETATWENALEELRCLVAREDSVPPPGEALASDGPAWARPGLPHKPPVRCAMLSLSLLPVHVTPGELEAAAGLVRGLIAVAGGSRRGNGLGGPRVNGNPQPAVTVIWIVAPDTPSGLRDALRRAGFPILIRKPLHEIKLHQLLATLAEEQYGIISPCGSPVRAPERGSVETAEHGPPESPRHSSFVDWSGASLAKTFPPRNRAEILSDEPIHVATFESTSEVKIQSDVKIQSPVAGEQPLKGLTVLVAEDSPVLQLLAVKSVKKLGAEVVTANDGGEALAAFGRRLNVAGQPRFDMVLIDCQMPVMSGLDVTRCIRALEKGTGARTPVVMLTATASAHDQHVSADAGVDLYLTKPVDATTFAEKVQGLLRKQKKV